MNITELVTLQTSQSKREERVLQFFLARFLYVLQWHPSNRCRQSLPLPLSFLFNYFFWRFSVEDLLDWIEVELSLLNYAESESVDGWGWWHRLRASQDSCFIWFPRHSYRELFSFLSSFRGWGFSWFCPASIFFPAGSRFSLTNEFFSFRPFYCVINLVPTSVRMHLCCCCLFIFLI